MSDLGLGCGRWQFDNYIFTLGENKACLTWATGMVVGSATKSKTKHC